VAGRHSQEGESQAREEHAGEFCGVLLALSSREHG
jgi:hypothetical protein